MSPAPITQTRLPFGAGGRLGPYRAPFEYYLPAPIVALLDRKLPESG